MTTITVRKLNPDVHNEIRIYAAKNGRSVEAEVRDILATYVRQKQSKPKDIAKRIQQRFAKIDAAGIDSKNTESAEEFKLPERKATPEPMTFDE